MRVKACAYDVGMSPLKLRRVADRLRGKRTEEALSILEFIPSPAARALYKVIRSACANAENNFQMASQLRVCEIFVDKGHTLKRGRAGSRGYFYPILRRSSHVTVVVEGEIIGA
jgi:large subunit ribosomal protein L22